jgi:zinc-finger protein CreA/MIG
MVHPNPSAFNALSNIAVEELHALEHAEALRRAEYEVRHAEMLRRAEYEARHGEILTMHGRVSKSASTTPLMSPDHSLQPERDGYFSSRDYERVQVEPQTRHRHHARQLSATSSRHTSGHTVDSKGPAHLYAHAATSHPYHQSHRPHRHASQDDCPSPASSDSDSMHAVHSPDHASGLHAPVAAYLDTPHYGNRTPASEIAFTPSTSPFLGGMGKLNIHSTVPSRAPSPFHLPPPSLGSPVDGYHAVAATSSPSKPFGGRKRNSTGDLLSLTQHSAVTGLYQPYPYSNDRSVAYLPTPQLSSGPSSSGSSPRSHTNSLNGAPLGSGSLSTSSSRAPSPPLWSREHTKPAVHQLSRDRDQPHHHHLAHSVRVAFGMTPIHPRARPTVSQYNKSRPFSDVPVTAHLSSSEHANPSSISVPHSRSSSPPIKLPPLKLSSTPSSPPLRSASFSVKGMLNDDSSPGPEPSVPAPERVELPRFSEIEAATGLR